MSGILTSVVDLLVTVGCGSYFHALTTRNSDLL